MSLSVPIIPSTKNYWLVRTQGGKYYNEFGRSCFIAVNWDKITLKEINELTPEELTFRVKKDYPDKPNPG
jgi:restriction system protein